MPIRQTPSSSCHSSDVLRGAKEIAAYYPGDPAKYRSIYRWCQSGRFPHFREGKTLICARKSTIDKWIRLQEIYAMQGKTWGPEDVAKHFPHETGKDGNGA
jgi:hypothetical protein